MNTFPASSLQPVQTDTAASHLSCKKILIIQVSRIGDTLFATPAIRAIAQACPDSEITVLGHPKRCEVYAHLPFVHHVAGIEKHQARFRGWLSGKTFDLAFVFGFDEALVNYALRVANKVIAFTQKTTKVNSRLYKTTPLPTFQSEHAVKQLLRLPALLGWEASNWRIAFAVTSEEQHHAQRRLQQELPTSSVFLIGLQVASFHTKAYRDWPIESFSALAKQIKQQRPNAHFVIFGGTDEHERTHWLHQELAGYSSLFAGKLSLRETAACMSQIHLYIGVDTGPTHIMSAFDIPMVLIYHCLSSSQHTGPLQHPCCTVIDHLPAPGLSCAQSSLSEISVDQVYQAVRNFLK